MTCVRCHAELTSPLPRQADDLCTYCATLTQIEAERGLAHLEAYLAKWAAFERWLDARLATV